MFDILTKNDFKFKIFALLSMMYVLIDEVGIKKGK